MYQERCPNHTTSLKFTKISSKCHACYEDGHANKQGYKCDKCDFYVHEECINPNIPSRHKHPLRLKYSDKRFESCCLCERNWQEVLYQCSQCEFHICTQCARKPLIFNQNKAHKHELHQVPINLIFTCDACGSCTSGYPCICNQCCFIVHRKCIYLPRVIFINRHDHRISHVSSLGPSEWICGVCRTPVNGECGAYSCFTCPYAVHSNCATSIEVWDGRDLEGIPEEEEEEGKPFEVINDNLIKHFSHQHNLKVSLGFEEDKHCYACTFPLNTKRCYKCTQCDFILDDACTNLPLRKRHPIDSHKLTLDARPRADNSFVCSACLRFCTGFRYTSSYVEIDVRCASITDAFKHESHTHLLFPFTSDVIRCNICDSLHWMLLSCISKYDCGGFSLCFTCATLPTEIRHKYDDHPLSLCYAERNVNSTYYCVVCEDKIYPKSGFYWCSECDFTLHTKCVYKNLLYPRPGYTLLIHEKGTFYLLPNDSLSRPTCYLCKTRCLGDLVLNNKADTRIFMCSSCGFQEIKVVITD